jgi:hypothetical protein
MCWIIRVVRRVFDAAIAWLMGPRVRRLRRWAFVIALPAAIVVAHVAGARAGATVLVARLLSPPVERGGSIERLHAVDLPLGPAAALER